MDIRLTTLIKLSTVKNYTKTANQLHLTQPAITSHIKSLEQEYKLMIFDKNKRKLGFTPQGLILLDYAKEVYMLEQQTKARLAQSLNKRQKYFISATLTIGEFVLPKLIGKYKENNPDIDILMNIENTQSVFDKLNEGLISLGIVEGSFDKSKYNHQLLEYDQLCFIVSPKSHLASKKTITIIELFKENFILREEGSGTREVFKQALAYKGYPFEKMNVIMEIGNLNAISQLVAQNIGVSVLSKRVVSSFLDKGELVEIEIENLNLKREFCFVYSKVGLYDDFIQKFIKMVLENK